MLEQLEQHRRQLLLCYSKQPPTSQQVIHAATSSLNLLQTIKEQNQSIPSEQLASRIDRDTNE